MDEVCGNNRVSSLCDSIADIDDCFTPSGKDDDAEFVSAGKCHKRKSFLPCGTYISKYCCYFILSIVTVKVTSVVPHFNSLFSMQDIWHFTCFVTPLLLLEQNFGTV